MPEKTAGHSASFFTRFARATSRWTGRPTAFLLALAVLVAWAVTGPIFRFSDTWQLVINTGTTIVTFLMVFLIQNSQNRDSEAIQLKLDELIRSIEPAQNRLMDLEEMDEKQLEEIRAEYLHLAELARKTLEDDRRDTVERRVRTRQRRTSGGQTDGTDGPASGS